MSRIAIIADAHARGKDLEAFRAQALAAVRAAADNDCELILWAGDLFDRSNIGDTQAGTGAIAGSAVEVIEEARLQGLSSYMITGNHDQAGAGSEDALHIFDHRLCVVIIRTSTPRCQDDAHEVLLCCLPWQWAGDIQTDWHTLCTYAAKWREGEGGKALLLGHVQVVGALYGEGGRTCEPSAGKWQITRQMLEDSPFDHIALGDFHRRQELVPGRGGYVGALRQLSFGEEGNPAGFEIWDSQTGETEWIELDAAPRYRTVRLQAGERPPEPGPNEHLRVQFEGDGLDYAAVRALEAQGVDVEHLIEAEERVRRADVPEGIAEKPQDLIRLWAAAQEPAIEGERLDAALAAFDRLNGGAKAAGVPELQEATA